MLSLFKINIKKQLTFLSKLGIKAINKSVKLFDFV